MPRLEGERALENNAKVVVSATLIITRHHLNKQDPDAFELHKAEKIETQKIRSHHPSARMHHKQFVDFDHLAGELDYREEYDSYYKGLDLTFSAYNQGQATCK